MSSDHQTSHSTTLTITLSTPLLITVCHIFHKACLAHLPSHLHILHHYYHIIHHFILQVHHLIPHNIHHPSLRCNSILLKDPYIHHSYIHHNLLIFIFSNLLQCRTATFPNNHLPTIINRYLLVSCSDFINSLFVTYSTSPISNSSPPPRLPIPGFPVLTSLPCRSW